MGACNQNGWQPGKMDMRIESIQMYPNASLRRYSWETWGCSWEAFHLMSCPTQQLSEDKNMYHSLWSVAKKVDIFVYRYGCSPMKSHDPNQSIRRPRQTQGGARQGIIPLTLVSLWAQQQQQLFLALEAVWLQQHDSSTTAATSSSTSSRQPQAAAGSSRQQQASVGSSRHKQTQQQ